MIHIIRCWFDWFLFLCFGAEEIQPIKDDRSCYKNTIRHYHQKRQLLIQLYPGLDISHNGCFEKRRAQKGCDCDLCELFRHRSRARVRAMVRQSQKLFDDLKYDLTEGQPVPDSPDLWEAWPEPEGTWPIE